MIVLEHATLRRPLKTALRVGLNYNRDTLVARKVLTEAEASGQQTTRLRS